MIRQCCQCKKIAVDGHWVYPRFNQLAGQEISHGYCDRCFSKVKRQIRSQHCGVAAIRRFISRFF